MNALGRATLLLCLGVVAGRLVITERFGSFVQQHMRIPLLLAAVVLVGLGIAEVAALRHRTQEDPEGTASPPSAARLHRAGPAIGWLLGLPIAVLFAVAPSTLGAAAADRVAALTPAEPDDAFAPIPPSDAPTPIRLFDFVDRALWDEDRSLAGRPFALTGIVVNDPSAPDGFVLTRFFVSCCAADGLPIKIQVRDLERTYPDDTWVEVTGIWIEPPGGAYPTEGVPVVELRAQGVTVLDAPPREPYESPWG